MVVGYSTDDPDEFCFIVKIALSSGTIVKFTDNAWTSASGPLASTEGLATFTVGSSGVTANSIICVSGTTFEYSNGDCTGPISFSSGSAAIGTFTNTTNFSASGDQLLVYTGTEASPNFISAINMGGPAAWRVTGSTTSNDSYLPSVLSSTNTNLNSSSADNGFFNLSNVCTGDITTTSNWTTNSTFVDPSLALPIELKYFFAQANLSTTLLTFSTATELNNSHFAIERSADARNFTEIGRVQGAGTTQVPQSYTFTDEKPLAGTNYYRLRQVDFDGTESFSPVVSVEFGKSGSISIAPSPATDRVHIQLEAALLNDGRWQVFDNTGRQVLSGNWEAESADFDLDVNVLPEGMYTFRLAVGAQVQVKQFRKM
jgi:hypothetical protein